MNKQAEWWEGSFGTDYVQRNRVQWRERLPFWQHILDQTGVVSAALEYGCGSGWNLLALRELGVSRVRGIEVNETAALEARAEGLAVINAAVLDCLQMRRAADLTFTAGFLIHVAPDDLFATMAAIVQASRKWVLAIEYAADKEEMVEYRGATERLWRRPFGMLYTHVHGLELIEQGEAQGWENTQYWLMRR